MPSSVIRVYNTRYNQWAERARVSIQFNGLFSNGFTREVFTNSEGYAYIEHSGTREVEIYVNGMNVGSFYAPGSTTVHI